MPKYLETCSLQYFKFNEKMLSHLSISVTAEEAHQTNYTVNPIALKRTGAPWLV